MQTKSVEKPVMLREQILSLLGAITDLHDLCLLYIGNLCGPRPSEVFGFQWASWNGDSLLPLRTAYEVNLYVGRTKTKQSKAAISVPDQVRPVIEAWKAICPDTSPDALMFPTFGRGKRKVEQFLGGEELPQMEDSSCRSETRHTRPSRHLPGDATYAGNRHAKAWDLEGHARHSEICQHSHNGRHLCSVDRCERATGGELPHVCCAQWLDSAGRKHGG